SRRRHTRWPRDWSSDVCSSDLLLNAGGVITMEFPHLQRLIDGNQFDTIYHEHFSYFSLTTVHAIFARHGLVIFDVEELPMHGERSEERRVGKEGRSEGAGVR